MVEPSGVRVWLVSLVLQYGYGDTALLIKPAALRRECWPHEEAGVAIAVS